MPILDIELVQRDTAPAAVGRQACGGVSVQ